MPGHKAHHDKAKGEVSREQITATPEAKAAEEQAMVSPNQDTSNPHDRSHAATPTLPRNGQVQDNRNRRYGMGFVR
jgi:hypothetical protein